MVEQQPQLPNVRMYKCPTNTSHQTRFSSSKTFQKASQRTNFLPFFPSWFPSHGSCYHYLMRFLFRYPNLHEVRLIPTKRDIAFVEFLDEGSAGVAKDALHNYKLDGENKIKVHTNAQIHVHAHSLQIFFRLHLRGSRGLYICCSFCSIINAILNLRYSANYDVWSRRFQVRNSLR